MLSVLCEKEAVAESGQERDRGTSYSGTHGVRGANRIPGRRKERSEDRTGFAGHERAESWAMYLRGDGGEEK